MCAASDLKLIVLFPCRIIWLASCIFRTPLSLLFSGFLCGCSRIRDELDQYQPHVSPMPFCSGAFLCFSYPIHGSWNDHINTTWFHQCTTFHTLYTELYLYTTNDCLSIVSFCFRPWKFPQLLLLDVELGLHSEQLWWSFWIVFPIDAQRTSFLKIVLVKLSWLNWHSVPLRFRPLGFGLAIR